MTNVSVIIPCLNASKTMADQLEALAHERCLWPWEIIVADNGSTDGTLEVVQRFQKTLPNLRLVDASARRGQPYALNAGVRASTGDCLLFCDADDVVAPGWLAAMAEALTRHDFVACRIEAENINEPWVVESLSGTQADALQIMHHPPHLPYAGGGTIGIRRHAFEAAGGFDEELPAYHDAYLCLRAQLAGTTLHFVPEAAVQVRYRHTLRGIYRQGCFYGVYNALLYKKGLALGFPRSARPFRAGVGGWVELVRQLPGLGHKTHRASFAFDLGWRIGCLLGSVKYRVLAL